jgi:signal transduction histidine kinase
MISNLVTNASEAIQEKDGTISVTTARLRLWPDSFQAGTELSSVGEYMMFEISDTGSGISPDLQGRIFDPFFTTKSDGRGLGLSVVQGIVRQHRGTIAVWSAPSQGTRFRVMLPLSDATGLRRESIATSTTQPTRPT